MARTPELARGPKFSFASTTESWMYSEQATKDIETIRASVYKNTGRRITALVAIELARRGREPEWSPHGTPAKERVTMIGINERWLREAASSIEADTLEAAFRT